ncbi:MAG: DUF1249 domain-containing protein [Proteobacteria bacterium]|nr:DUF1249 domain-containing protein [Pseudomonadota bacterium]MDA1063302.1 DUF1249 domain-containing protein [Pseudomonadota bacterium]
MIDCLLVPQTIVRPNSFVGLMSLYESNYLRLLQLIPEIERLDGCFRSRVAGECDLYVEILERCRYTVTLSLTYRFDTEHGAEANPNMVVRIYFDGALAEAMGEHSSYRHHKLELDARWKRNIILNKWLEYLGDQGHLILER